MARETRCGENSIPVRTDGARMRYLHVVCSGTGVVSECNTEVLDGAWSLFRDFLHCHNFADSRLNLLQTTEKVPESGLCGDDVWSVDRHLVDGWLGHVDGWELSSGDDELGKLQVEEDG